MPKIDYRITLTADDSELADSVADLVEVIGSKALAGLSAKVLPLDAPYRAQFLHTIGMAGRIAQRVNRIDTVVAVDAPETLVPELEALLVDTLLIAAQYVNAAHNLTELVKEYKNEQNTD